MCIWVFLFHFILKDFTQGTSNYGFFQFLVFKKVLFSPILWIILVLDTEFFPDNYFFLLFCHYFDCVIQYLLVSMTSDEKLAVNLTEAFCTWLAIVLQDSLCLSKVWLCCVWIDIYLTFSYLGLVELLGCVNLIFSINFEKISAIISSNILSVSLFSFWESLHACVDLLDISKASGAVFIFFILLSSYSPACTISMTCLLVFWVISFTCSNFLIYLYSEVLFLFLFQL
jgi:hypothetical protein